jgi:urease accessory protein
MNEAFLKLLQVCDSVFPVGAYTMSNGLETYVQKDILTKPKDLEAYLSAWLAAQTYNDLAIAARAFQFADDIGKILWLDELSAASKIPREIREGSHKMCSRFFKLVKNMGVSALEPYAALVSEKKAYGQYAVAFGIYARCQGTELENAIAVLAYSLCSAVITNCVKLVPLSQVDGQRILYGFLPEIYKHAEIAINVPDAKIGLSLPGLDIRSMQHERLFTRQYIS